MILNAALLARLFGSALGRGLLRTYQLSKKGKTQEGLPTFTFRRRKRIARALAEALVADVRTAVLENVYGRRPKSPFTKLIQGADDRASPMVDSGVLLNSLKIYERRWGYLVDWSRAKIHNGKTADDILNMHEKGYRVDLKRHPKVRAFIKMKMKAHGLPPRPRTGPKRKWLITPARPFYISAVSEFISKNNGAFGIQIVRFDRRVHFSVPPV